VTPQSEKRPLKHYRVLVIEQQAGSVAECLHGISLPASTLHIDRLPWSESLGPAGDRSVDLLVPVAPADPDSCRPFFTWLERQRSFTPVLAVLPAEASDGLLNATSEAVDDFVLWPTRKEELQQRITRIIGPRQDLESVRERLIGEIGLTSLVGADASFVRTIERIPRMALSDGTVLITGETGTGKELCARAVHHLSRRRSFPFVPVDCGGFPEQLMENELFGHVRGAFTDARGEQKGLAALAQGGTLFLDEIDALSLAGQAKLLRFLEDRTFKPLGAERFTRVDVRMVAATNHDLEASVEAGRFRPDLFFRLNVFRLRLPPLRERPGDIALLADHFLESMARESGTEQKALSPGALRRLTLHRWPGNVRELHNVVQRAVAFTDGSQILPSHISLSLGTVTSDPVTAGVKFREARAQAIQDFERLYIQELLHKHHGNITRAAREGGQDRRAFGRLVKKHQVC
jgi:DNA-binding NtrC family response regulator